MNTKRTEQTANGLATYSEPTFRVYAPETVTEADGRVVVLQLCEEWVCGRWEGWIAILSEKAGK